MSINSAMLAGVSGLVANSSALAAISDNIANVNTVAYKRSQVNFANVVTAQTAQGRYSAGGVQGVTHTYISTDGQLQSSSRSTDMAIAGDGFFVVTDKAIGLAASDPRKLTRNGSFGVDENGFLMNDSHMYLQGWPVQANGTFASDPSDFSKLQPINIANLGSSVKPTGNLGPSVNLDSTTTVSAGAASYNAATASMADYAAGVATGTKPDYTFDMNVTDSLGSSRKLQVAVLKTGANTWQAELYAVPASDVAGTPSGQLYKGAIKFLPDGTLDTANTTFPTTLNIGASGATAPAWAASLGLGAQKINLDLSQLTQQASTSTVNNIVNDGAGVGNIKGVKIGEDGVVSVTYDNNTVRTIAKIAIATVPNPDGLQTVSGNAYQLTTSAGSLVLKDPGVGGAGKVEASSLEASTVDLSSEFTGLISTQKAYSASSKIITTADQMLDELINIIR